MRKILERLRARQICLLLIVFVTAGSNLIAQMPANYQLETDWLIDQTKYEATVAVDKSAGKIRLSNGLIQREFDSRFGTTVRYSNQMTGQSIIRAVEPEGSITLDGITYPIGGASGQPNKAFLTEQWLNSMQPLDNSLKLIGHEIGEPLERLKWKRVRHHAPDSVWPPKGKYLRLDYAMPELSDEQVLERLVGGTAIGGHVNQAPKFAPKSDVARDQLMHDDFGTLDTAWKIHATKAHVRSSFQNEGKAGEIYTPAHTSVFAEQKLPAGTASVEVKLDVGTDVSSSWGPGIALVFSDRIVKFNIRPGDKDADPMFGTLYESEDIYSAGEKKN